MDAPVRTAIALMALAGIALTLGGCVSSHTGSMGQAGAKSGIESQGFDGNDPVIVSGVRERALSLIQDSAANPDAHIRTNAIEAASLSPERLQAVISHALDDRNAGVRSVAAMSVGKASLTKLAGRVRPL